MATPDSRGISASEDDTLNAAQGMFSANPVYSAGSMHFLQAQDRFLREAETFCAAWFNRRHDATRTALDAGARITQVGLNDPASALKILADWQAGSLARMAEDAKECAEMVTRCAGGLVTAEMETANDIAGAAKPPMPERHATPV
jgi:hypothetical protein